MSLTAFVDFDYILIECLRRLRRNFSVNLSREAA